MRKRRNWMACICLSILLVFGTACSDHAPPVQEAIDVIVGEGSSSAAPSDDGMDQEAGMPEKEEEAAKTEAGSLPESLPDDRPHPEEPEQEKSPPAEESQEKPQRTFTLTIPEGYTLARIGMALEEKGVCTAEAFIIAAQAVDTSQYPLLATRRPDANRCFALEGYLFPDTYEFYTGETPDSILDVILKNTERRIAQDIRTAVSESGYTMDEIITLASIIEKEAYGQEQMSRISAVLHNRLKQGMRLQCDVTINYVEGAVKPFIAGDRNRYNAVYNTYKCAALPAGPICNPGIAAIRAALTPAMTKDLYFVTDREKRYYYAETWDGHEENLAAVKKANGDIPIEEAPTGADPNEAASANQPDA